MNHTPNPQYETCMRNGPVLGLSGLGNQWPSSQDMVRGERSSAKA